MSSLFLLCDTAIDAIRLHIGRVHGLASALVVPQTRREGEESPFPQPSSVDRMLLDHVQAPLVSDSGRLFLQTLADFLRRQLQMSSEDSTLLLEMLQSAISTGGLQAFERLVEHACMQGSVMSSLSPPAQYFVLRFYLAFTDLGEKSGDICWLMSSLICEQISELSSSHLSMEPLTRFLPHIFARAQHIIHALQQRQQQQQQGSEAPSGESSTDLETVGAYVSVVSSVMAAFSRFSVSPVDAEQLLELILKGLHGLHNCLSMEALLDGDGVCSSGYSERMWQTFGDLIGELVHCLTSMPQDVVALHALELVTLLDFALTCRRRDVIHMALSAVGELASLLGPTSLQSYSRPLVNAVLEVAESRPPSMVFVHALSTIGDLCSVCPAALKSSLGRIVLLMKTAVLTANEGPQAFSHFDACIHLYNEFFRVASVLVQSFETATLCELDRRCGWFTTVFELMAVISTNSELLQHVLKEHGVVATLADFLAKFSDEHASVLGRHLSGQAFPRRIVDAGLQSNCYEVKTVAAWTSVRLQTCISGVQM